MPFAATTRDAIMGILGLPVTVYYVQQVQDALNHAEVHGGDPAIQRIEDYVFSYQDLERSLTSGAGNAAMIRADVIEWAPGGQSAGVKSEMHRIKKQVADALLLGHLISIGRGVRLVRR